MSLNRSFVFLRYPETHLDDPSNPDDYLRNPNAATKVVQSLKKMGIKCFLVLPGRWPTLDDYRIIGRAIEAAGLQSFPMKGGLGRTPLTMEVISIQPSIYKTGLGHF